MLYDRKKFKHYSSIAEISTALKFPRKVSLQSPKTKLANSKPTCLLLLSPITVSNIGAILAKELSTSSMDVQNFLRNKTFYEPRRITHVQKLMTHKILKSKKKNILITFHQKNHLNHLNKNARFS